MEFRKAIEVYAVRLAAIRCSDADMAKLKALLKRMKRNLNRMDEFEQIDKEMHLQVARTSRNAMFLSMLEIVYTVLGKEMTTMLSQQGRDIDSYFYHQAIVECIEAGKPDEASYMMEKHLAIVMERIKAIADK